MNKAGLISLTFTAAATLANPAQGQFQVRLVDQAPGLEVGNIETAEAILANPPSGTALTEFTTFSEALNYGPNLAGASGSFFDEASFPGGFQGTEDFALEALAKLTFVSAGTYIFRVNSDDGFRFRTGVADDGSGGVVLFEFAGERGTLDNSDSAPLSRTAGATTNVRLTYFERSGGEALEFAYSRDGGAFKLVGADPSEVTASPVPEPTSSLTIALGVSLLGLRRRR